MQLTDQTPENPTLVVIAWLIAACTLGYMLPWAVAVSRRKSNHAAIGLVTFFLGWTAVGWIIALVMAAGAHHPISAGGTTQVVIAQSIGNVPAEGLVSQPQTAGTGPPPGYYPSPDGAGGQRYWDGTNWA